MIYYREYMGTDGFAHVDNGETPDSEIFELGQQWITDDRGKFLMIGGSVDQACVETMAKLCRGPKVLEIGYGMGYSFAEIRKIVPSHDVIDLEQAAYDLGRAHWPERYDDNGERYVGDYMDVLDTLGRYDSIYIDADERLLDRPVAIRKLRQHLRLGGIFVTISRSATPPELRKFEVDQVVPYSSYDGDKDYEKHIRQILKRKNRLDRFDELVQKNLQRYTYSGEVIAYRATR